MMNVMWYIVPALVILVGLFLFIWGSRARWEESENANKVSAYLLSFFDLISGDPVATGGLRMGGGLLFIIIGLLLLFY
ncbi:hypothetical protein Q9251_21675 [Alkalihalobacillus macyae]|uniref:hypothetical protein n=1 Tax=Guptibacillus hwajinpoensis TaxID=208199 RepID=UPI00273CC85E|nr:hypothetical protein [Alkalihalobacillus macyae]MDP4553467.1 hypothetical protein [Alkalihalobacillus macyae]